MANFTTIIGRNELIDILDADCLNVPAKIDTGALASSVHVTSAEIVKENGKPTLVCEMLGHPCFPKTSEFKTTEFEVVTVRSSNGIEQDRFKVKLKVRLAKKTFVTGFTLALREKNVFPVLIGREAIRKRFMVDVARAGVKQSQLVQAFGLNEEINEEDLAE